MARDRPSHWMATSLLEVGSLCYPHQEHHWQNKQGLDVSRPSCICTVQKEFLSWEGALATRWRHSLKEFLEMCSGVTPGRTLPVSLNRMVCCWVGGGGFLVNIAGKWDWGVALVFVLDPF